ncbi:unnamed protein product, partial [Polarella glacialis]
VLFTRQVVVAAASAVLADPASAAPDPPEADPEGQVECTAVPVGEAEEDLVVE